jgi:hypothetical protein
VTHEKVQTADAAAATAAIAGAAMILPPVPATSAGGTPEEASSNGVWAPGPLSQPADSYAPSSTPIHANDGDDALPTESVARLSFGASGPPPAPVGMVSESVGSKDVTTQMLHRVAVATGVPDMAVFAGAGAVVLVACLFLFVCMRRNAREKHKPYTRVQKPRGGRSRRVDEDEEDEYLQVERPDVIDDDDDDDIDLETMLKSSRSMD